MTSPSVSVIMPVRNARRFVSEAMDSVLSQSFKDFEFLIIDDGSSDGTPEVLARFAQADSRVKLTVRENRGLVRTLNDMLFSARGEFIARMDADDVSLPDRLEKQLKFLCENPDTVCLGAAYLIIDEEGRTIQRVIPAADNFSIQANLISGKNCISHPSVLMRRQTAVSAGGYDVRWHYAEDLDLWLRLGEVGELRNHPDILLKYRVHDGGRTWENMDAQYRCIIRMVNEAAHRRGLCTLLDENQSENSNYRVKSKFDKAIQNSYWSQREGERETSIHYAMQAVKLSPWRAAGWKSLFKAVAGIGHSQKSQGKSSRP